MGSRVAFVRVFLFTIGVFCVAVGAATIGIRSASAGWQGLPAWGCPGGDCTLTEACQSFANFWAASSGPMGVQEIIFTGTNTLGAPTAICRLDPRIPLDGDHWDEGTALGCTAGEVINLGLDSGCQKWEEPEQLGSAGGASGGACGPACTGNCCDAGTGPGGPGSVGNDGKGDAGNPITLSNGNKFEAVTDYRSGGSDAMTFTRYYNSLNWLRPTLGHGWRHSFLAGLDISNTNMTWAHRPDGTIEKFISATGGNPWVPEKGGIVGRLAETPTGWTYTRADDTVETYNSAGQLESIAKKNGYTQSIEYVPGGTWRVTDSYGRTLTLYHTNHGPVGWRLTRMVDPDGRIYSYEYRGVNAYNKNAMVLNRVVYPDDVPDAPGADGTTLLTHVDGPDGATTATDESAGAHSLVFQGTTQIDTAESRFGGAAALFDGAPSSFIGIPDSDDWHFGAGPFTAEAWVRFSSTASYSSVFSQYDAANSQIGWLLDWTTTQLRFIYSPDGTLASRVVLAANWTPTVDVWHHLAVDRDASNRLRVYVDGNVVVDTTVTAAFHNSTRTLRIGTRHTGWIDEVRITKGVARYGRAFAPPGQPFLADPRFNNPAVTYHYEDSRFGYGLTGITDETGQRTATWSYNEDGRGLSSERAKLSSEDPNGVDLVTIAYNPDGTRTVTNPLGKQFKYTFETIAGLPRITQVERLASALTPAATMTLSYDGNGFMNGGTDYRGAQTTIVNNARGLPETRTRAVGTPEEQTVTTEWETAWRLPRKITEPERETVLTYYPDGLLHTRTVTDRTTHTVPYATAGESRTWTYTYHPTLRLVETVDGPRTDVADVTTYAYDPATGNLLSVTNALGHVTQITEHDASGRPLKTLDANGVETTLAYDARGRLASRTADSAGATPATTVFTYDDAGQMATMTLPDGSTLTYGYDAADRLSSIENDAGERIEYGYDPMGNRTLQLVKSATGEIVRTAGAEFDDLGRLLKSLGAYAGEETVYGYDANGNQTAVIDPLGNLTQSAFDPLNRLIRVTDPAVDGVSGVAEYGYDAAGNMESATDQRSLATTYVHNGFGEVIQRSSPDTGVTIFEYDSAGNRTRRTDARGVVTEWSHDALGRATEMRFTSSPGENVAYAYDDPTSGRYGIGRLASVTDDSGSTASRYDARGNVVWEQRVIGAQTYLTEYGYDIADRLVQLTYPSGRIVDYVRDGLGRIASVEMRENAAAAPQVLAATISWEPFGPLAKLHYYGYPVLPHTRSYDLNGRLTAIDVRNTQPNPDRSHQDLAYGYDLAGNIETITDALHPERNETYSYDALHRLRTADAPGTYGSLAYDYDAVGNRTRRTDNGSVEPYSYNLASNRLDTVVFGTGPAWTVNHGDSGNITGGTRPNGAAWSVEYDASDRMVRIDHGPVLLGTYVHNATGQRVSKTAGGVTTHFIYDLSGKLIAEHDDGGAMLGEYVWLEDMLLTHFAPDGAGGTITRGVLSDHIGRPVLVSAGGAVVEWEAIYLPFGALHQEVGTLGFNLRFSGQYHDRESNLHYNWFRTYDARLGRYLESDPIGLQGGWNTYAYVGGNPVMRVDPSGLRELCPPGAFGPGCAVGGGPKRPDPGKMFFPPRPWRLPPPGGPTAGSPNACSDDGFNSLCIRLMVDYDFEFRRRYPRTGALEELGVLKCDYYCPKTRNYRRKEVTYRPQPHFRFRYRIIDNLDELCPPIVDEWSIPWTPHHP